MATKKISHTVKVYAGTTENESSIGLSGGVCSWTVDDQTLGILTEKWVTGINLSVDMSVSGNYARYSDPQISIVKSSNVETILNNIDLSLINSRIEIESTDGTNTVILYRGVIKSLDESGNIVVLMLSHLSNYYATQLSPNVGDESIPIAWGDSVDGVKLPVVQAPKSGDLTIGDNLIPAFVVYETQKENMLLRSVYDDTLVTEQDLRTFLESSANFIVKGENTVIGVGYSSVLYKFTVSGKDYWTFYFDFLPLNIKDDTGTPYLPLDSTVVVEPTSYGKYYKPYGSDTSSSYLQYKDGDVFYNFPEYVDSRKDYSDRIEILDADNSGDAYIDPIVAQWDVGVYGDLFTPNASIVSKGVWEVGNLVVSNVVLSNEEKLPERFAGFGVPAGSTITCNVAADPVQNQSSVAFISSYDIRLTEIPEELYFSATDIITQTSTIPHYFTYRTTIYVKTILQTYEVYSHNTDVLFGTSSSFQFYNNLFPTNTESPSQNEKYRWDTGANSFEDNVLGRDIELLNVIENEYEKTAPISIITVSYVSFRDISGINTIDVDMSINRQVNIAQSTSYNTNEIYLDRVGGKKEEFGLPITSTGTAYFDTLTLQNFSNMGYNVPSEGWGLGYTSSDVSGAIASFLGTQYQLDAAVYNTSSKELKIRLLTLMSSMGYIDNQGKENLEKIYNMYFSGVIFNAFNIEDQPDIQTIDPTRVYPYISVSYNDGTIEINNIEQDTYSSSYVTGLNESNEGSQLWRGCKLLYDKYGIKNTLPDKMRDIKWLDGELTAVEYIKDQLLRMGVEIDEEVVTLKARYTLKFNTDLTTFFKALETDLDFWIGSSISFTYPNIASAHTGVVTALGFNPTTGKVSVAAEMVGDLLERSDVATIIESGTQTDNIVESGTQTTNYVEEI